MEFVTQDDLRRILERHRSIYKTQRELAGLMGVKPQNLSQMLKGAPINGRALKWLGYEAVQGLYRPLNGKRKRAEGRNR